MRGTLYIRILFAVLTFGYWSAASARYFQQQDTVGTDTLKPYEPSRKPTFRPAYRFGDPFSNRTSRSPLFLRDPSQLNMQVQFNPDSTADNAGVTYSVFENIGSLDFRPASFMTFEEFNSYNNSQLNKEYFKDRSAGLDGESAVSGRSLIPRLYISPVFDRIFGGSYVDIQPNGFVNLDFGGRFQRLDDPSRTRRQQRNGSFNFDQQISMNVVGKVGEKLAITANFDNNNTFDFQNNLKVEYTGYEEDIIKKIEIGNVSMPVSNSLISGAQSLFGFKTELQFGKLFVTTVFSQQRSRNETLVIENGEDAANVTIDASNYQEDQHFFMGHFFRDNYERWLLGVPEIPSGVVIRRVEVYVVNNQNNTEDTRSVVGFLDLGEGRVVHRNGDPGIGTGVPGPTRNEANGLNSIIDPPQVQVISNVTNFLAGQFPTFESGVDFETEISAVRMDESLYTFNSKLGYISLNRPLGTNEMLAVSYEYAFDGQVYKVGEMTEDYQNRADDEVIYLKLLRPAELNTQIPSWDLMMKNVYGIGGSQIKQEGFELKIIYRDDDTGQDNPSLHEGKFLKDIPLVEVLGLDRLNPNNDRQPDGNFDFIPDATINTRYGTVFFPVLEPFGDDLREKFDADEGNLIDKYVYDELYDDIKNGIADQVASKDKFSLQVKYAGSSSCTYQLRGINVAEGSVVVRAGNTLLAQGRDYTLNAATAQVIINQDWCVSGKTITIDYEQADLFNFQTRTLTGARFDYRFNDSFNIGGTILHLNERPGGISRFAVGNEPNSNTKYGFDINYQNESRLLTKMVDALPLVSTKEPSTVTFNAEFAQLIPGTSNKVNGEGTSYIDDFESAITPINIGGWQAWRLGTTPRGEYPIAWNDNSLANRYNAAKNSLVYRRQ